MSTQPVLQSMPSCRQNILINKYDIAGPRYTSYPTAPNFLDSFDPQIYNEALTAEAKSISPLSLYVHIPFCHNICYYCACNKIVTSDKSVSRKYLDYLIKEIAMQSDVAGSRRRVTQLHLGGGTPTFLDGAELTELMHHLAAHFSLIDNDSREYSIEIDPRSITVDTLALLKGLGFNRLSFGIQDFDPKVQAAINRTQRFSLIKTLTDSARLHQFKSISYDLIYGLPFQTSITLSDTLEKVIGLSPDRIAFYNYAHLPERFKSQRSIDRHTLPTAEDKLMMLELISTKLQHAGYVYIGMDHFVKSDDDLAVAQQQGRLLRNFQGYSTSMASDLIGIGVSSISSLQHHYTQNERSLENYYQHIDQQQLPIVKGVSLTKDDKIRRAVISSIICNLHLDTQDIDEQFDIAFLQYFDQEIADLLPLEKDGLIKWHDAKLLVTDVGRPMLRNICMVFDKYLQQQSLINFSKAL